MPTKYRIHVSNLTNDVQNDYATWDEVKVEVERLMAEGLIPENVGVLLEEV